LPMVRPPLPYSRPMVMIFIDVLFLSFILLLLYNILRDLSMKKLKLIIKKLHKRKENNKPFVQIL